MVKGPWMAVLAAGCAAACGTQTELGGGAANLPDRGAAGFDGEAEVALDIEAGNPLGATVAPTSDGGWWMLAGRIRGGCLGSAHSEDGVAFAPDEPPEWACPEAAWEGSSLRDPSVVMDGERVLVWHGLGSGAGIGLLAADSAGAAPIRLDEPVLLPEAAWEDGRIEEPTVVRDPDGGGFVMLYSGGRGAGIGRAVSDDGRSWRREPVDAPILSPTADGESFDTAGVLAPFVRRSVSPLGRAQWDLWYVGKGATGGLALGFAGSFDGRAWSRHPFNPVIDDSVRPGGPWVAEVPAGTALYLNSAELGITVRIRP